ncbi:thrombospondin-type laminin G domain and EAR repeat-containing protein-like [Ptychodera flava]|uniref:thrombospondin-type laminin G domain and EAR repeat-containing protein-like n=1 Tax=Ptychodera flava TaxID=63121 RepID=UPI003969CEBD
MMDAAMLNRVMSPALLLCFFLYCHANPLSAQYLTHNKECTDYHVDCFPDNVCAYTFLFPRQESETCPELEKTMTDIRETGQEMQRLQHQLGNQQHTLQVLQQQMHENQRQIDQMKGTNTAQQQKIENLEMLIRQLQDTPGCCQQRHHFKGRFEPYRNLTSQQANNMVTFEVSNAKYIAMVIQGACEIYHYSDGFTHIQTITADTVILALEHIEIDNEHYLALALSVSNDTKTSLQWLYKWRGSDFKKYQIITTQSKNPSGWAFTKANTINGRKYFLAMANHREMTGDELYDIDSVIYVWNGHSFIQFQDIRTKGAYDATFFTIHGSVYLGFANGVSMYGQNAVSDVHSELYKLNVFGTSFEYHQTLPIPGKSKAITTFNHQGNVFLIDVQRNSSSFASGSPLYLWNTTTEKFDMRQMLPSHDPPMACAFKINGDQFLVMANFQAGSSPVVDWIVYKIDGLKLTQYQVLDTYRQSGQSCSSLETADRFLLLLDSIAFQYT